MYLKGVSKLEAHLALITLVAEDSATITEPNCRIRLTETELAALQVIHSLRN